MFNPSVPLFIYLFIKGVSTLCSVVKGTDPNGTNLTRRPHAVLVT
jgi:hypothetical protein